MRIIFSAVKKNELLDWLVANGAQSFLFSYEDKKVFKQVEHLSTYTDKKFIILIDSGAFSAWNRGLVINIDHYVQFIEKVKKIKTTHEIYFINLDVIPHKKGTIPTPEQIDRACKKGIENYFYIKDKGHSTIHTFHQFESFDFLRFIVEHCNDLNYIGISPANDQSVESRNEWLKTIYNELKTDVRTHVLGLTAKDSLEKFPCYSADSSSWINVGRFGELFDYDELEKIPKKNLNKNNLQYFDPNTDFHEAFKYYLNLEKYITDLWTTRGIKWKN
tara:strand:+ start:4384 stop:5208 length:825 start_codon:yes stop_codon:yes gene_type:complete